MSENRIEDLLDPQQMSEVLYSALKDSPEPDRTIVMSFIKAIVDRINALQNWKDKAEMKLIELGGRSALNWIEIDEHTVVLETGLWITTRVEVTGLRCLCANHIVKGKVFKNFNARITHAALVRIPKC